MKHVVLAILLLVLYLPCRAQSIDSMINTWNAHGIFNGGVIIVQKGHVVYQRSAGYANFETGARNTETTPFNLASVSKPFTAIAILQLVHKNKLKLNDALAQYLPDFPYPAVTIEQLLSHTSGLPEADQFEKPYFAEILSNRKIYAHLVQLKPPPLAAAGEKHFYNNLNFILLAVLVEKITKTPFEAYMQRNIFRKAGMKDTYVRGTNSPNTARYFLPTFYDTAFQHVDSVTNRKIYTDYPLGGTQGDNNVITTLQDMVMFDKALNNGKLLPSHLVKLMYQPVKLANGKNFFMGGSKTYTLGWNVNEKDASGKFAVWHDGSLVGLTTIFFRNLTDSITYMMYENRNVPNFFRRYLAIQNIMDGRKPAPVSLQKSLVREYGATLVKYGPHPAACRFNELKADTGWYFYEHEMNELGYHLLLKSDFENRVELALEVFKLNTLLFPGSTNAYDSYAEALMNGGLNAQAIAMYKKSLQLDPSNAGARRNLEKLISSKSKILN
ncbi:serine hydrolase domain-containing protein [Chitinophaga niabensis]|uniref:serine hydrolase domain-containing protein n=1 Tax=Chitinophaga niabensis TaxID=536979 RepID=UPI0031BA3588